MCRLISFSKGPRAKREARAKATSPRLPWSPRKKDARACVNPLVALQLSPPGSPVRGGVRFDIGARLPTDLLIKVYETLGVPAFVAVPAVSKTWMKLASSDTLWRDFYRGDFNCEPRPIRREEPSPMLELSFATPASAREVTAASPLSPRPRVVIRRVRSDVASPTRPSSPTSPQSKPFKVRYQRRLESPIVGDAMEVSWHGKFRLESCEVHAGCAWWAANVVDKLKLRDDHGCQWWYKVTFPGWQGRWDEWVPRERLRWPVKPVEPRFERDIKARDSVEVWCSSKNVPGAWLEARVTRIKNEKYLIGRAHTANGDPIWVDRSRLRLSQKEERRREQRNGRPILSKIIPCSPRRASSATVSRNLLRASLVTQGAMPSFVGRGFVDADEPDYDETEFADV